MSSVSSSPSIDQIKQALRGKALANRDAMPLAVRQAASSQLVERGQDILDALAARLDADDGAAGGGQRSLAAFLPIRSEVDLRPLIAHAIATGWQVGLPVIVAKDEPLIFRAYKPGDAMADGPFKTQEPLASAPVVVPDIVLVPLAAFDREGRRMGYGGGFYDRTLARLRAETAVLAIGVAFQAQEVDAVPTGPHDMALDMMLTDTQVLDLLL